MTTFGTSSVFALLKSLILRVMAAIHFSGSVSSPAVRLSQAWALKSEYLITKAGSAALAVTEVVAYGSLIFEIGQNI